MIWVIMLVRMLGLRSFSKMTAFDFIMTIATGSILAGAAQATEWPTFVQAIIATGSLFLFQYIAALARQHPKFVRSVLHNEPVFLMRHGELHTEALSKTRVTASDVYAKLREANALQLTKVYAVVLETTGDISLLHGDHAPDDRILASVDNN